MKISLKQLREMIKECLGEIAVDKKADEGAAIVGEKNLQELLGGGAPTGIIINKEKEPTEDKNDKEKDSSKLEVPGKTLPSDIKSSDSSNKEPKNNKDEKEEQSKSEPKKLTFIEFKNFVKQITKDI